MTLGEENRPAFVRADGYEPGATSPAYGPFSSRRAMRAMLASLAHDHALCLTRLALERRVGPCFSRQLRRCRGACDGAESGEAHDQRLREALAPLAIPKWPFEGAALIREASDDGERVDVHVVRDWAWLGTARDEGELALLLEAPPRPAFDVDVAKLLLRTWARRRSAFVRVQATPASVRDSIAA
jgi:DNA polymerase-3 subunit epsilon